MTEVNLNERNHVEHKHMVYRRSLNIQHTRTNEYV